MMIMMPPPPEPDVVSKDDDKEKDRSGADFCRTTSVSQKSGLCSVRPKAAHPIHCRLRSVIIGTARRSVDTVESVEDCFRPTQRTK
jgi:hypothetical protein